MLFMSGSPDKRNGNWKQTTSVVIWSKPMPVQLAKIQR